MESESGVTRNTIDEFHSSEKQRDRMEGGSSVTEVSLMNFILRL